MIKKTAALLTALACIAIISGCATVRKDIWFQEPAAFSYWYDYEPVSSIQEAASNIENMLNEVTLDGLTPSDIEIDPYSIRFKLKWTENTYYNTSNTIYGANWLGLPNYSGPTYIAYQTNVVTSNKEKTSILKFKELSNFILINGNYLSISFLDNTSLFMKCQSMRAAKNLGDSIMTLAKQQKVTLSPMLGFGSQKMTAPQQEQLLLREGAIISGIQKNGPADKAGLKINDIVLEINRDKVGTNGDYSSALSKLESGKETEIKILRWEKTNNGNTIEWQKITKTIIPLSR